MKKVTKLKQEKKLNSKMLYNKQKERSNAVQTIMDERRSLEPEKSVYQFNLDQANARRKQIEEEHLK